MRTASGWTAAILGSMLLMLPNPAAVSGQVSASGFVGVYDRGQGNHPFFYLAVGGRLSVNAVGPLYVEGEALHVPAHVDGRSSDLFAYRGNLLTRLAEGEVEPFLLVGIGWQQWRTWLGEGPEAGFRYDRGLGYVFGAGAIFLARDPVRFRIDLRHERSDFPTPVRSGFMGTMSVSVVL